MYTCFFLTLSWSVTSKQTQFSVLYSRIPLPIFFFFFFFFSGPHLRHMEVPRLGVASELYLPAYATATATPDPSCVSNLHHSAGQHQFLNPLARDGTRILMDTSQMLPLSHDRNPYSLFLYLGLRCTELILFLTRSTL